MTEMTQILIKGQKVTKTLQNCRNKQKTSHRNNMCLFFQNAEWIIMFYFVQVWKDCYYFVSTYQVLKLSSFLMCFFLKIVSDTDVIFTLKTSAL